VTISSIVASKELGMFIVDFVQLFARGSVPMVKTAISIGRNDDILGDTGSVQWSPSIKMIRPCITTYLMLVVGIGSTMFSLSV